MTDTEKILEAVSQGPLPLHVLRRRTGLNHGLEMTLRPLVNQGRLVRQGDMVALPVPSYADPIQPLDNGDDPAVYGEGPLEGPPVPMESLDPDATREMRAAQFREDHDPPDEEPTEELASVYYVATEWTEVEAIDAEIAADQVLGENPAGSSALVMLAEEGIVFERALVVRRRSRP